MDDLDRLLGQLRRAFDGDAWSGPSLLASLHGLDAEAAGRRPIAGSHTIAELAAHCRAWIAVATRRLVEGWDGPVDEATNFPAPGEWSAEVRSLADAHNRLIDAVAALGVDRLDEPAPGQTYSLDVLLRGVAEHNLYHAGQVMLLRKATGG